MDAGLSETERRKAEQGEPAHGETEPAHGETDTAHGETDTAHGKTETGHGETDTGHADTGHGETASGRRGDTRVRIRQVALELFAEQGYERTSLREIAERLSVTKAALYYHFKSKEDIVRSFIEDYIGQLDALIEWARGQQPGPALGGQILERYVDIVMRGTEVFRFLERNQAAASGVAGGKYRFEQFRPRLVTLVGLVAGPGASHRARVRATASFFAASGSCMLFMPGPHSMADPAAARPGQADSDAAASPAPTLDLPAPDELRAIVVELTGDLTRDLDPAPGPPAPGPPAPGPPAPGILVTGSQAKVSS